MTTEEFDLYMEEIVLSEIETFASIHPDKSIIVSWRNTEHPFQYVTNYLVKDINVNGLYVFITKSGNKVADINLPQLIFGLDASGKLTVYSALKKNTKPEPLESSDTVEKIQPSHIQGFLVNQLRDQESF
jgi:hypothetical protein